MSTYDETSQREQQTASQLQESIVVLLEQISKSLTTGSNLPTKDELKALKVRGNYVHDLYIYLYGIKNASIFFFVSSLLAVFTSWLNKARGVL